jgi:hypothetical protein
MFFWNIFSRNFAENKIHLNPKQKLHDHLIFNQLTMQKYMRKIII